MPLDVLAENEVVVRALGDALRSGTSGLEVVPGLVKRVVREGRWQERAVGAMSRNAQRRDVRYDDFVRFVTDPPLEGLGTSVDTLKRLCRDDAEALDAIDVALKCDSRQGERTDLVDNIHKVNRTLERPSGTSADRALRALREHNPRLHALVLEGKLSPHAAMLEAGLRKRTLTVPMDPEAAARTLRRHFTPEQIDELIAALEGEA